MKKKSLKPNVSLWEILIKDAKKICKEDSSAKLIFDTFLFPFEKIEDAITSILLDKLKLLPHVQTDMEKQFTQILKGTKIKKSIYSDLIAFYERDPACHTPLHPFLFYKGFHALVIYRISHHLWQNQQTTLALYLQSVTSKIFSLDIHPAAKIASCTFIDHGHSIVIGETCVIESGVSIMQDVTLGGTGKEFGDRHPKIEAGVLIGAGAKILGNIRIGKCSKIGASSVVLKEIPPYSIAVGTPAKVVATLKSPNSPAQNMDHFIDEN